MLDPKPFQHCFLPCYELDNFRYYTTTDYYLGIFFTEKRLICYLNNDFHAKHFGVL